MPNQDPLYDIQHLDFSYALGNQQVHALRDVSLTIDKGDFVCLTGPSGSGKTTLLSVLGLIEPVQKGKVVFEGKSLSVLSEGEMNHLRRHRIGFVFQQFHLIPVLSAEENVSFFLSRQGVARKERQQRVDQALDAVGLADFKKHKPLELSGGQRQRVAIARAMAKNPDVIIADEPTANLDQATGHEIMKIFKELNESKGVTLLVASHDPMVQAFAPRQVVLRDGQVA